MRQIKFRAWVVSGDYSEMLPNVQNHIGAATGFGHLLQGTAKGIHKSHVMQFTGLTDINGVEIYEGDIVYVSGHGSCEVKICPYYGVTYTDSDDYAEPHADCAAELDYPTVIGNIYQNPELLK